MLTIHIQFVIVYLHIWIKNGSQPPMTFFLPEMHSVVRSTRGKIRLGFIIIKNIRADLVHCKISKD
jgi:hypothetical protein